MANFLWLLPANTDETFFWCPIPEHPVLAVGYRHEILNHPVVRMQLRLFQQHLKAAPVFVSAYLLRLQCQSAGSLKTQECIISRGYSCGPCGFNSVTILSSHFSFAFPVSYLAYDNNWGDCSFQFDLLLDVFINWCQICQSTTGLNRLSIQQANNKDDNIKHIQISDLSSATPTCTAFLIVFEYIIFSTCQLTIS